jgi:hypothetical protein
MGAVWQDELADEPAPAATTIFAPARRLAQETYTMNRTKVGTWFGAFAMLALAACGSGGCSSGPTSDPAVVMACNDTCSALTTGACGTACAQVCADSRCTAARAAGDYQGVMSIACSAQAVNFEATGTTYACPYSGGTGADPTVVSACDDACTTLAASDCTVECMNACLGCAAGQTAATFQSATAVDCFPTNINFTTPTTTVGCPTS